jgi:PmbA protein
LDEEAIEQLTRGAMENLQTIESDEKHFLYRGAEEYAQVRGTYEAGLNAVPPKEKIDFAVKMEQAAKQADPRVAQVGYCMVGSGYGKTTLVNTFGLNLSEEENIAYAVLEPVIREGENVQDGVAFAAGRDFSTFDAQALADQAVREAASYLGASKISSGKYPVLLRKDVVCSFLGTFLGVFSADQAQKGYSLLKDKEGETIASELVTLCDDPLLEAGFASRAFDAEGVPTYTKNVIEQGKLTTLLHNLRTANKQGVRTTGNASRPSYASNVGVLPTNFYIKPGEKSYDELVAGMEKGLVITQMMGMHSGANAISGDFSLGAKGFYVENGEIVHPVEQITVAGNFFALLKDIAAVGGDLWFDMPGACSIGGPSLLVRELSVAGA